MKWNYGGFVAIMFGKSITSSNSRKGNYLGGGEQSGLTSAIMNAGTGISHAFPIYPNARVRSRNNILERSHVRRQLCRLPYSLKEATAFAAGYIDLFLGSLEIYAVMCAPACHRTTVVSLLH